MMRAGFKISIEWTGPDVGRLGDWERDGEQGREIGPRDIRVQERGHLVSADSPSGSHRGVKRIEDGCFVSPLGFHLFQSRPVSVRAHDCTRR
jgi:hypothetical protein